MVVGLTSAVTISAIIYSHVSQVEDKKVMRAGVERDKERLRQKRLARQRLTDVQNDPAN